MSQGATTGLLSQGVCKGYGATGKGGGSVITDIVTGYGLIRERTASGYYGDYYTMFNVDRTKRLGGSAASPGGGITNVTIQTLDPATGTLTQVSAVNGSIGQSYPFTGWFNNMVTIAPDDSYVLSVGNNNNAGAFPIYRIDINTNNYTFASGIQVIFNDSSNRWKQPRIINAQQFVSFTTDNSKQQEISLFEYDSVTKTASITKTLNVGFNITAIDIIGRIVCVIGLNDIVFIDLDTEQVLFSDNSVDNLSDVRGGGTYFFVKTISSQTTPVLVYAVDGSSGTITKLNLTVSGEIPSGSIMSPINIIKDDNRVGDKWLLIFQSNNGGFLMLAIEVDTLIVHAPFVSGVLTGSNSGFMPYFIAGNFISYVTSFSGTPRFSQTCFFRYAFTTLSFKMNGNKYVVSELAA